MQTAFSEQDIRNIVATVVRDVLKETGVVSGAPGRFVFDDMDECVAAANTAAKLYAKLGMEQRRAYIKAMRAAAIANAEQLARLAYEETGYGSVAHKVQKCVLAAEKTPGVEDLETKAVTGDEGLTLTVSAPFGVIGSITPSTNPVATVVNNGIGMAAAGNTVVFAPHPSARECSTLAMKILNEAAMAAGCPVTLFYCVAQPDIKSSARLIEHPDVRLLSVTGGEAIVSLAMKSGKKVIGAGPGNPPVIVDETANIQRAAKDIVDGASFENDILCIAEKEIFVVRSVGDALVQAMVREGAQLIGAAEAERLAAAVLTNKNGTYIINRDCVGKDAAVLLGKAGISVKGDPRLIVTVTERNHPFVTTEMLMPIMPVVYVGDVDEAIECAVAAERGCHHSAHMHSTNVENLSKAASALDTTIFVKNAPSYAGVGFCGEGYCTFTIATPTGEGLTSAKDFTRSRRCVLRGSFEML